MIGSVITWSGRNSFLVLLATAFIIFAGVYALQHTALDAIPDLSDTQVIVYTEYPGPSRLFGRLPPCTPSRQ
jgi:copper/silver efflux system protein